jgi:hypothetical protein
MARNLSLEQGAGAAKSGARCRGNVQAALDAASGFLRVIVRASGRSSKRVARQ